MDTLIIGGQKYEVPSDDVDVIAKAQGLLSDVKQVATRVETEEQLETMYAILDEIEALVEQ